MARHGLEKQQEEATDRQEDILTHYPLSLHIPSYSKVIPNLVIPKINSAMVHCSIKVIFSVLIFLICWAMIHLCFRWKRCLSSRKMVTLSLKNL